jgi:hypothetical protein
MPLLWTRPALRAGGLGVMVQRGAGLLALAVTIAFVSLILSARQQRADARAVAESAATVVSTADHASASAQTLIGLYEPLATKAAPLAQRFVDDLTEEEIHAAIGLVNHLPELTLRMEGLLPILATLDTVSPEIHQLLEEVQGVRQAIQGVPGFKFFRKRGEAQEDED